LRDGDITPVDDRWYTQVEMTPTGTLVTPGASPRERRLLQAKYDIFQETIGVQKRWRKKINDALEK
jgi:hypothetical protein